MQPDSTPRILAIASLVCGALSVLLSCCCYGAPFNLLGLVLGIVSVALGKNDPETDGRTYAYVGIGLSVLSFVIAIGLVVLGVGMGVMSAMLEQM